MNRDIDIRNPESLADMAPRILRRYDLYFIAGDPDKAYQEMVAQDIRIKRLEEISADLAAEVDRLWHEKCQKCGEEIAA